MRKGLLVILLVAASFAGGSVINGPGLSWVRRSFHDYLTEVLGTPGIQSSTEADEPAASDVVPVAPLPKFTLESLTERHDTGKPTDGDDPPSPSPSTIPRPLPPLAVPEATTEQVQSLPARPVPRVDPALTRASVPATDAAVRTSSAEDPWTTLRRRMQDLKIKQYWIEGQPEGPVRFRCVVPVIGANLVAQHFEAEASDEYRAAEAVLRRVTIWRASEGP